MFINSILVTCVYLANLSTFRCDSIDKLKMKCPGLEQEIREPSKFKDFYQFTFNYAKNPGQKGLGKMGIEPLLLCMLGNFACFGFRLLIFFQNYFFFIFLHDHNQCQ